MRAHRFKSTSYGQKGGEGPNKGKKRARYQAVAPDGTIHVAAMMVAGKAPRTAFVRFLKTEVVANGQIIGEIWEASGVREEKQDWGTGSVWIEGEIFG